MTSAPTATFPVVAIGGSAGSLEAFFKLFDALERLGPSPEMAFMAVLHLPPDEESYLPELLSRRTRLPVDRIDETNLVDAGRVYVLPPGKTFDIRSGALVMKTRMIGAEYYPVDDLFKSVAREFGTRSVAIVCSGTGSNGSAGLGAIREAGGCVLAQEPSTAEFDEMPRCAIATGFVDLILPPQEMAQALARNARRVEDTVGAFKTKLGVAPAVTKPHEETLDALEQILQVLRTRTAIDFRQYKTGELHRRIDRRVHFKQLDDWNRYVDLLKEDPQEADVLMNELLITVTRFFRDRDAWQSLAQDVFEPAARDRSSSETFRIWTAGCATGEEAYSAGISILEAAEAHDASFPIEIFATDPSQDALSRARRGRYPAAAINHLPEALKSRWFACAADVADVKQTVRERIIFAPQDLIKDPPFSRADLVICRNVLSYLKPEIQQRLIRLFHFSLREGGYLFLGASEGVGDATDLFEAVDEAARIFRRLGPTRHEIVDFPLTRSRPLGLADHGRPPSEGGSRAMPVADMAVQAMAAKYAPPSVLIDGDANILYYHGTTSHFFRSLSGEATHNLMALAHDALVPPLFKIIEVAKISGRTESCRLKVPFEKRTIFLLMEASRVSVADAPLRILVSFLHEMAPLRESTDGLEKEPAHAPDDELGKLRAAAVTSARAEEEMKAYNIDVTSMNEELETSKEELQSLNEELQVVNAQLREKVLELQERTADLDNLLASTDIATLFLDSELQIRWFSPNADKLFYLRDADLGRPISHVVRTFSDDALEDECQQVLRALVPVEAPVTRRDGRTFMRRIAPYRSNEERAAGVVISLTDVTEIHNARHYAERIVETTPVPFVVLDPELRIRSSNSAFYRTFGLEPDKTEGHLIYSIGNGSWDLPELRRLLSEVLPDDNVFNDYEIELDFGDLGLKTLLLNGRRLDHVQLILLAIEDITARKQAEAVRSR